MVSEFCARQVVKNATQDLHGSMQEGLQKQALDRFDPGGAGSIRWMIRLDGPKKNGRDWNIETIYRSFWLII